MKNNAVVMILATVFVVTVTGSYAARTPAGAAKSVAQAYPRPAPGVLIYAQATELPDRMVLRAGLNLTGKSSGEIIGNYMDSRVLSRVTVTDAEVNEVFRHVGYWPPAEIEKKLTQMGVK